MALPAQLLVVSPDSIVLQAAQRGVQALGHSSFVANSLAQARRVLARVRVDLICLDSVLPADELERFWRAIRGGERGAAPPVVVFGPPSAQLVSSRLPVFFERQRDGFVAKPVDARELARELTRVLAGRPRRARGPELLRVGSVALDEVAHQLLFAGGGSLALTPTEFRLLRYLMQRPGEFSSTEELLERVWGYPQGTIGPEVVRAHVSNLRRKLRSMGEDPQLLRTMPFQGYGFIAGGATAA